MAVNKFPLLSASLTALLLSGCGGPSDVVEPKIVLAVIGDAPYGTSQSDTSQFNANPGFIAAINKDPDVALVIHAGDIHSGKQYCTQAYDAAIFDQWRAFKAPLVYTPGDNEWTDCHKAAQGGGTYDAATARINYVLDAAGQPASFQNGDPVANLQLVRQLFFVTPGKSVAGAMDLNSQALAFDPAFPADKAYVENSWFEKSRVMFVTVNVPGGSNNDTDPWYGAPAMSQRQADEVSTRSAAALRWLDTAFRKATDNGDSALLITLQADMWDADGKPVAHLSQYKQFIDRIAANTKAFGKPVLLINGDSHIYRSDNPLKQGAACATETTPGIKTMACTSDAYASAPNGYDVANFHRLVVHGSTAPLEWLKLTIDPSVNAAGSESAFGPFSWVRVQP